MTLIHLIKSLKYIEKIATLVMIHQKILIYLVKINMRKNMEILKSHSRNDQRIVILAVEAIRGLDLTVIKTKDLININKNNS